MTWASSGTSSAAVLVKDTVFVERSRDDLGFDDGALEDRLLAEAPYLPPTFLGRVCTEVTLGASTDKNTVTGVGG